MALTKIGIDAISGAIGTTQLEDGAVTSAKIATGGVATVDMADGSVTSLKIANGGIDTVDIADSAITTAKIANGTIALADLSATGTASSSTFLRGDNSWQVVAVTPTAVSDQDNTSTGYFDLPSGTTAQRPGTPTNGMIRYNTSNGEAEIYINSSWQAVSSQSAGTYSVDYLIVAGGGAGGSNLGTGGYASAGGGAGGVLQGITSVSKTTAYSLVVGAGSATAGYAGNNSTGLSLTAIGGGAGSPNNGASTRDGGSGGGAGDPSGTGSQPAGSGTTGQGYGGGAAPGGQGTSGGGGGAGAVGSTSQGGIGINWQSLGTYYAGGGSGTSSGSLVSGGQGGGGSGGAYASSTAGGTNTGGGGGGSYGSSGQQAGKTGGSGIIIIRYVGGQRGTGGTVTSAGGYTYHTFTSSGTFTA